MVLAIAQQTPENLELWADLIEQSGAPDQTVANQLYEAVKYIPHTEFLNHELNQLISHKGIWQLPYDRFNMPLPYTMRALSQLALNPLDRVLLLGAGSGFTMAMLCLLRAGIFCVEPAGLLAQKVRQKLDRLHYQNAIVRVGEPESGWREYAPFDAILSEHVLSEIPESLLAQLAPGGRLVTLIGDQESQTLVVGHKHDQDFEQYTLEDWDIYS